MARVLTMKNAYDKVFTLLKLDGMWRDAIGADTEAAGAWLIYGKEKNGKTTFALRLANYLSTIDKVLYISAEEGVSVNIINTCKRVGISDTNRNLHLLDYISINDLRTKLARRKSESIIFIDNTTEYRYEMKNLDLSALLKDFPQKLFIILSHESSDSSGEPDIALARFAKKKAKRIFHIVGMSAQVLGRTQTCEIPIDSELAALCHGDHINQPINIQP